MADVVTTDETLDVVVIFAKEVVVVIKLLPEEVVDTGVVCAGLDVVALLVELLCRFEVVVFPTLVVELFPLLVVVTTIFPVDEVVVLILLVPMVLGTLRVELCADGDVEVATAARFCGGKLTEVCVTVEVAVTVSISVVVVVIVNGLAVVVTVVVGPAAVSVTYVVSADNTVIDVGAAEKTVSVGIIVIVDPVIVHGAAGTLTVTVLPDPVATAVAVTSLTRLKDEQKLVTA